MKKIILGFSMLLIFAAAVFAQTVTTPAKNSPLRKAILAIVKKKFPAAKKEAIFKVQGNWARVVYDQTDDGASAVNVVLKKTGQAWKIVWDYNTEGEGEDINDHLKGVPEAISNPWN